MRKFEPAQVGERVSLIVPATMGMQTGEHGWHMRVTKQFEVVEANDQYFVVEGPEGPIRICQTTGKELPSA